MIPGRMISIVLPRDANYSVGNVSFGCPRFEGWHNDYSAIVFCTKIRARRQGKASNVGKASIFGAQARIIAVFCNLYFERLVGNVGR